MAAGILLHPFLRIDHQQGGLSPGCAGDHVLQELDVSGSVENQIVAETALEEHPGGVDRDTLRLLVLQGIEEESILERFRVQLALSADLLELPLWKGAGVREQPTNDRALAMIDVADDHDAHPLL